MLVKLLLLLLLLHLLVTEIDYEGFCLYAEVLSEGQQFSQVVVFPKGLLCCLYSKGDTMLKELYYFYIRPLFNERGQNLIEYTLLIAIIVGIGYLIYSQSGLQQNIEEIFKGANYWSRRMMPATRYFD